jgi:sugar phosphate isomerase/epimerase
MRTIRGPAIFLAQFLGPEPPFDRLDTLASWAAGLGYRGVQIPTFNPAILDVEQAAVSDAYCDEIRGRLADRGVAITEISMHRHGHLVAVNPAYDLTADVFAPEHLRGNPAARQAWAVGMVEKAVAACHRLGVSRLVGFPGSLLWPHHYLYPPRPAGLVEEAYAELSRRWRPILDLADASGVDVCFEIHPAEDVHDGLSFETFLAAVGDHPRCNLLYDPSHLLLQHIDYVGFLDVYHQRIKAMHVKDAEFNVNPRTGTWGGYRPWLERAGRFRSLGDGQIDFGAIFSRLAQHDFEGWAVLEWECCLKHPEDGAREGAAFIRDHIIRVQARAFDVGMAAGPDRGRNRRVLGLE